MSGEPAHTPRLPVFHAALLILLSGCSAMSGPARDSAVDISEATPAQTLRVATFNTSLYDPEGRLAARLQADDPTARHAAAVLQYVRPDIVLLNEFDYDETGEAMAVFRNRYLARSQSGQRPIDYPYAYAPPVNTGVPSGLDINGDGRSDGPNDAWGFGEHPGQYGMLLLSRFPIDTVRIRTFQLLPWSAMPDAHRPTLPDSDQPFHPDPVWQVLRLSSKTHADVPLHTPLGTLHVLAAHPTPPIFDGPEALNRRRNFDELRLWADYLSGGGQADWIVDDQGRRGGFGEEASFVLLGDLNADPLDGNNLPGAANQLLKHPRVLDYPAPRSDEGARQRRHGELAAHRTDPGTDTGSFGERTGNLRVDYVLPSRELHVVRSGVFWPAPGETGADWITSSDHRLVWVDLARGQEPGTATAPPSDSTGVRRD